MVARTLSHTFLWAPVLLISIASAASVSATSIIRTYPAIFVFGDSLSDTGNGLLSGNPSALRTTEKPYGETFPGWPAQRYSDGHVLVDLLAMHFGLPLLNPYLNSSADFGGGINYAVAGATAVDPSVLESFGATNPVTTLSLDVQLSWHLDVMAKSMASPNGNSEAFAEGLYVIEFGGNDYTQMYLLKYPPSFVISTLIPLVIQQLHNAVEALLSAGAKHFLFVTLPPLGCFPTLLGDFDGTKDVNGCLEEYNYASYLHGVRLQEETASLRVLYPDAAFLCMDFYGAYDYVLNHKEMFGFTETLKACCGAGDDYPYNFNNLDRCNEESASLCGSPREYVVWDGAHNTDSLNAQIFNQTIITGSFLDIPAFMSMNHGKQPTME